MDGCPCEQPWAQFLCGYHDLDLRDATGLGHGRTIAHHAHPDTVARWVPRLLAGDLAGIAITEPHGGSRVTRTRTRAVRGPRGQLLVPGRKCWISRLTEAAVFTVLFRAPAGHLAAAVIDTAVATLTSRDLPRLRDTALVTLGTAHTRITTALLGCAVAAHHAHHGDPHAELWSAATKAHGVDTAHQVVADLAPLAGAAGYRIDSPIAKAAADLAGYRLADGVHDSLNRTAGKHHTHTRAPIPHPETALDGAA
ncbi:acyl-CoA dehydrogenase family protein [Actinokineospora diospyrosa]|uniref:Acyl-CoA dehydrogenase, C-terminal domain n=1 Tax=Actinokineospora diospyrosa TaxID=103728 RepID=A0ABT1IJ85_9PSEU|nr:acyl-CoA dehydrogenase family protein [Actinokineospora diospyrosa]MCP2272711.1 Acyl-CoA dehydrogenase, C-terminal domain [Actinokineospora diospyrosa]